jgi:hypothetical protein
VYSVQRDSAGPVARFVTRIVSGDGNRKTRFHTMNGTRVDARDLLDLPRSVWTILQLRVFGRRAHLPWLSYRAVAHLEGLMRPDWRVLEFGSGMSSLFFARNARSLVSIEANREWYERMRSLFSSYGLTNVDYRLQEMDDYAVLPDLPDASFDLVIIDGAARDREARAAIRKVRPGGYVFYDNSDVPWPEFVEARRLVIDAAAPDAVWFFSGFSPFQISAMESVLVRVAR